MVGPAFVYNNNGTLTYYGPSDVQTNLIVSVTAGNLTLDTTTPTIKQGLKVSVTAGGITLNTTSPTVTYSIRITVTAGNVTLDTTTVTVKQGLSVVSIAGDLTLNTTTVTLKWWPKIDVTAGNLYLDPTGVDVYFGGLAPVHLYVTAGNLDLNTTSPDVTYPWRMTVIAGDLELNTTHPNVRYNIRISVITGPLTLDTTDPNVWYPIRMSIIAGNVTLNTTGPDVTYPWRIPVAAGNITLNSISTVKVQQIPLKIDGIAGNIILNITRVTIGAASWIPFLPRVELHERGTGDLIAVVFDAFGIKVTEEINTIPQLEFSMPADSIKRQYLEYLDEVWLYDWDGSLVDCYIIKLVKDQRQGEQLITTVTCSQVADYLADLVLPGEYKVDLRNTSDIIADFMGEVQGTAAHIETYSVDGDLDYPLTISCSRDNYWDSFKSIQAQTGGYLRVVPEPEHPFDRAFELREYIGRDSAQQFRYRKNMLSVTRTMDASKICTLLRVAGTGTAGVDEVLLSDASITDTTPTKSDDGLYGYLQLSDYGAYYGWSGDGNPLPIDPLTGGATVGISGDAIEPMVYDSGDDGYCVINGSTYEAQTFKVTSNCRIDSIDLLLYTFNSGANPLQSIIDLLNLGGYTRVQICLYDTTGTPPHPTGGAIDTVEITPQSLSTSTTGGWYTFKFNQNTVLQVNHTYAIVVKNLPSGWVDDEVGWRCDASSPSYTNGSRWTSANGGVTWTQDVTRDFMFGVYVLEEVDPYWVQGENASTIKIPIADYDADKDYSIQYKSAPYLIDWVGMAKYGLIEKPYKNDTIQDPVALWDVASVYMQEYYGNETSYELGVVDLYGIDPTVYSFDKVELGSTFNVVDEVLGIEVATTVTNIERSLDSPGDITVKLSTLYPSVGDAFFDLKRTVQVGQRYPPGSSEIYKFTLTDNCDENVPHYLQFEIQDSAVKVGAVILNWYRDYMVDESGTIDSTTAVNDNTTGTNQNTTATNNSTTATVSNTTATNNSTTATNNAEATHTHVMLKLGASYTGSMAWIDVWSQTIVSWLILTSAYDDTPLGFMLGSDQTGSIISTSGAGASHNHTQNSVTATQNSHSHTDSSTTATQNSHTHVQNQHTHPQDSHTHTTTIGLNQADTMSNLIDVSVDGVTIPTGETGGKIDIRQYMLKDVNGQPRKEWHNVRFAPNPSDPNPAKIVASVSVQEYYRGLYNV